MTGTDDRGSRSPHGAFDWDEAEWAPGSVSEPLPVSHTAVRVRLGGALPELSLPENDDGVTDASPSTDPGRARRLERAVALAALSASPPTFAPIDARTLVERACGRARALAEVKDVDLLVYTGSGAVRVHRPSFTLALYELIENAVMATRRLYPVIVDVRETERGDVTFRVQDEGEGMSDETLTAVKNEALTPSHDATAGGVAFALEVALRHGGTLQFESGAGVGTTAQIVLPRDRSLSDPEPCGDA